MSKKYRRYEKMTKLEKIQKVMDVLKIITRIVLVLLIIGASLSIIAGIISLASPHSSFFSFLEKLFIEADLTLTNTERGTVLLLATIPLILYIFLAFNTYKYFEKEIEEGTPFTLNGAKMVLRLGIIYIVIDLVSDILVAIFESIFTFSQGKIESISSFEVGLCLLFFSLIFSYGSDLLEKRDNN